MSRVFLVLFMFVALMSAEEKIYASFDVAAVQEAQLAIKAVGIVKKINVDVSSKIKRGDILLELENESERLVLELAKNELELATLAKNHAKSVLDKFKLVQGVSSKQEFENAQFEFKQASLAQTKAQIALKRAQKQFDDTFLKAPFDGVISQKMIEEGEGVAGAAQRLFRAFSYPEVKLVLSFDEKFKDKVKLGSEFVYKFDAKSEEYRGKITLIYPAIDTKNGKIYAEIRARDLTPGLFGEGYILAE